MGFNDRPPDHVNSWYYPIGAVFMYTGGILYTLTYYLMTRQSILDRTYAMPILSLSFNFAWEFIFFLYVAASFEEQFIYVVWMLLDVGLIYAVFEYGSYEWVHAPTVRKHIGKILFVMITGWCWALWALCSWWISENVNPKVGKWGRGIENLDTDELGFWTASTAQVVLSCSCLAQLVVRGNSGGSSYTIWACRFFGSLVGLNMNYGWMWWNWPEAHGYMENPLAVCLLSSWTIADVVYIFVLKDVKKSEVVRKDGRKVKGKAKPEPKENPFWVKYLH